MSHDVTEEALPAMSPGTARSLTVHRFGDAAARPKAYLHAGTHADEIPGMLVLHHLIARLIEADRAGDIVGHLVIVPVANPIGLSQRTNDKLMGRHDFSGGENFNRNFADLAEAVTDEAGAAFGDDAADNVAAIRVAMIDWLAAKTPATQLEAQRVALMRLAVDADIVLDLHCDSEAVMHLFVGNQLWPDAADLSAQIGSEATMLAVDSGGSPFDEAFSRPWAELAERFTDKAIPPACLSATIELRGTADVDDAMAATDADNLFRFLQRRGVVAGDPGPLPEAKCDATPFEGTDMIVAPVAGAVVYHKAPGDRVAAGEIVAEIVDPTAADPATARTPLTSRAAGVLVGRHLLKFARPGEHICKVAGPEPLPDRVGGNLMTD